MALLAEKLILDRWRNADHREIALGPAMTILVGPNASGKTNAVEALQLLSSGSSFRRPRASQLVAHGAQAGRARLEMAGDGRVVEVECLVEGDTKRFTRNGKALRPSSLAGTLLSVLFSPDDLALVKGSASVRRDEADGFGAQVNRGFAKVLRAYQRTVEQRNRLLKEPVVDRSLLAAWDESVAIGGGTLLSHRLSLISRLGAMAQEVYGELSGGERLEVTYDSSLGDLGAAPSKTELIGAMARALERSRDEDMRRTQTTVGPHRDDVVFALEGQPARQYASQGQARTIVLAWKLAQVRFCEEVLGQRPILLLDDVMSELDGARREAVSRVVRGGIQTVVTTTHLGYFSDKVLEGSEVVDFGTEKD